MLGNLGFTEILVILVVALLIFGPNKLPELGKSLGQGIKEFKKPVNSIQDEVTKAVTEDEKKA
jgi:sec-independent protein translocase protein TatA